MKVLNVFLVGVMAFGLAACASESQVPSDNDSVVQLKSQSGNELMSREIDGKPSKNLSFFRVTPGSHVLELAVRKMGPRDSYLQCYATITYEKFMSSETYTLFEQGFGDDVTVELKTSEGKIIARETKVTCL
ncbi:hypothetical protein PsdCFBP2356_20205 [Pseudomonas syringae pv. dysoxyli]|uniref:PA0061/PA0062 family lipoprotein n=1 Tax=Pseudomonas syringae TaxID=317 RepID=UPI001372826D|nr:hypothetical protein [Pseudomonas syringae]NAO28842.1 hypothetical protein [Pseudomonas syringae pv. dysoxyli]